MGAAVLIFGQTSAVAVLGHMKATRAPMVSGGWSGRWFSVAELSLEVVSVVFLRMGG